MHRTFSKFAIIGAAFAAIVGITVLITGQPSSKLSRQPTSSHIVGVVDDWQTLKCGIDFVLRTVKTGHGMFGVHSFPITRGKTPQW